MMQITSPTCTQHMEPVDTLLVLGQCVNERAGLALWLTQRQRGKNAELLQ
jgi:hypothetical protein